MHIPHSCKTAALPQGFALNLANKLGVSVIAPDDYLWAYPNGFFTIGPGYYNAAAGKFVQIQSMQKTTLTFTRQIDQRQEWATKKTNRSADTAAALNA